MVGPVRQDHQGPRAWSADRSWHAQRGHDVLGRGRIIGLTGREDKAQRSATAVRGKVDLSRQPTTGASDRVVAGLGGWGPFLRAPAVC